MDWLTYVAENEDLVSLNLMHQMYWTLKHFMSLVEDPFMEFPSFQNKVVMEDRLVLVQNWLTAVEREDFQSYYREMDLDFQKDFETLLGWKN